MPPAVSPPASPSKGEFVYKIILIGSAAVGKTNLLSVAARGQQFDERSPPTLQPEFVTVKVQRPDWKFGEPNQFLRAQVWDTAGQERYQAISSSHYRRAHGAMVVYDVSNKATFKEVFPGVPGGNQWLRALKDNVDPALLAGVMLVENKTDKLDTKATERPASFAQEDEVKRLLADAVFRDPKEGLGWLHEGDASQTIPYRIANSLMFARTSALSNTCELMELVEKSAFVPDLLRSVQKKTVEYEKTIGVSTVSQALEALIIRIYERSKNMEAGGSKPSGQSFKKQLNELENAFLLAVEPRKPTMETSSRPKKSGGWLSRMKERMLMKLVCCAPPAALLDDYEIEELLATMEEAEPVKTVTVPHIRTRKELMQRKNSATVMPFSPLTKPAASEESGPIVNNKLSARKRFARVRDVLRCALALQKALVRTRQQRAAIRIQQQWRCTRSSISIMTKPVEPELRPEPSDCQVSSPKRRRRIRKHRGRKKTKTIEPAQEAVEELCCSVELVLEEPCLALEPVLEEPCQPTEQVLEEACLPTEPAVEESCTTLVVYSPPALARKRSRAITEEVPLFDVERDVHVLFGEEEIDEDDDLLVQEIIVNAPKVPVFLEMIPRCDSVPPPPTAFRPRPVRSQTLVQKQAANTIQRVWRGSRARVEFAVLRRLKTYEAEKQSVMPTIRCKMAELRKRLDAMRERSASVDSEDEKNVEDDDFDWL
ncbi:hypothetical protein Poli38472_009215 [Pythium oligandrum]|uniref:Uncharacterized protein n=1 Tax=Pythium oligandrum TaxID=41045 RepID=A0A8K1CMJ1_PYTOL|nr:hypothetical protein Poli38472_009215 [Pythium oligandrum]|eukprot:TMW65048.1 hypothetical protein Poli38472_009215 [Pythium oligandrum]